MCANSTIQTQMYIGDKGHILQSVADEDSKNQFSYESLIAPISIAAVTIQMQRALLCSKWSPDHNHDID